VKKEKNEIVNQNFIRKYSPLVVGEYWLFTIFLLGLLFTGIFLLRDFIYDFMGIYGDLLVETPANIITLHLIFAILFAITSIIYIIIHLNSKELGLLSNKPAKDFKAFLHSLFYLIKLSRREEPGGGDRYSGRQRIVYFALIYTIGLAAISGFLFRGITFNDELSEIFSFTHVFAVIFIILIFLFHVLITLRKHDWINLKCTYITGTVPLWYVKKHHKIWYKRILKQQKKISNKNISNEKLEKKQINT
jgi:cytochrome b subunit of formate dehydrogenase